MAVFKNWAETQSVWELFKDNAELYFGDSKDVSLAWNGSVLEILPVADDTGYVAIGNGALNMDLVSYGTTGANYVQVDAGLNYLSLVNFGLYAPNLATSAAQAGIIYYTAGDNILRISK